MVTRSFLTRTGISGPVMGKHRKLRANRLCLFVDAFADGVDLATGQNIGNDAVAETVHISRQAEWV